MNNSGNTQTFKYSGYSSPFKSVGTTNSNNIYDTNVMGGSFSSIVAGDNNTISSSQGRNFIGGGINNSITGGDDSVIVGSYDSIIRAQGRNGIYSSYQGDITQSPNYQSIIMASAYCSIAWGNATAIVGGYYNTINGTNNNRSVIIGGESNTLTSTLDGTILNGVSNTLTSSPKSSIIGGESNLITNSTDSSIIGGTGNTMSGKTNVVMLGTSGRTANANDTTYTENIRGFGNINVGNNNTNTSPYGAVVGGSNNTMNSGTDSAILGGTGQVSTGPFGAIIGGVGNTNSSYAGVVGGYGNNNGGEVNIIFGNQCRTEGYIGGIIGAEQGKLLGNTSTNRYSFLGGGYFNTITDTFSATILGGRNNTITSSPDSSIIGGTGNTMSGKTNVVMVGTSGRTALYDYTTHVENSHNFKTESFDVINAGSVGGSINVDCSLGTLFYFTITADTTPNFINWKEGQRIQFWVDNDGAHNVPTATITGGGSVYAKAGNINPTSNQISGYYGTIVNGNLFLDEHLNFQPV